MNNENINLKNKNNNLENENETLKSKLKNLEAENENLKTKNENLETENEKLKTEIENLKKENDDLTLKLKDLQKKLMYESTNKKANIQNVKFNQNNGDKAKIIELLNEKIEMKEKEIKELKSRNMKLNNAFNINNYMTVIFYSTEQNIHYSFICKSTDIFSDIEKRLYKVYPSCQDSEFYFIANEQKIKRFKTLQENKIKNSQVITIIQQDE